VSCVAALVVPDCRLADFERDFAVTRTQWRKGSAEVKGSQLSEREISQVIRVCVKHDLLLKVCAMDCGLTDGDAAAASRKGQAEAILGSITPKHNANSTALLTSLADRVERLSVPLWLQLVTTLRTVSDTIREAPNYYAQRLPEELAAFNWVFDRKDRELTPYERLWSDIVCPLLQTESLDDPFALVEGFDYSHMQRFRISTDEFPHLHEVLDAKAASLGKSRPKDALNVGKIIRESNRFDDSAIVDGLQVVDILSNAFARGMNGNLQSEGWESLGQLMILRANEPPCPMVGVHPEQQAPRFATPRQTRVMNRIKSRCKSMMV